MADNSIYRDIQMRTGGDVYIGVVGPVRTGKSTLIHKFLDCIVIPNIENEYDRTRALDQAPQSASGKTVMTTEPKFVPDEAVKVNVGDNVSLNCVVADKNVVIHEGVTLSGANTLPFYLEKRKMI